MLSSVRALLLLLLAAGPGCGEDRQCTFDVDCDIGDRCVATRCVPVQLASLRDAASGADAGGDAAPPTDSGPPSDAGPDARVELDCTLGMEPAGGVEVGLAAGSDETPLLVRSGLGRLGLVVRREGGLAAQYLDEAGLPILSPDDSVDGGASLGDFAITTASDGSIVVVWREVDDRLHGATVTDIGSVSAGELTDPATGLIAPAIARNDTGYVIAWADRADGSEQLATRTLDGGLLPVGASVRVPTPGTARVPALANVDAQDVPIAWNDSRFASPQPYAATRRPDGALDGEIEVSSTQLAGRVATVATPFGLFLSWIEPPALPGGQGAVHVSRIERGQVRDRVIARANTLDSRTTIAWDGDRLFVGWHRGAVDAAEATVAAVRPDLQVAASLALGENTARPTIAADESLRGVVWMEPTTATVWFGKLSCDPGN